jgi:hypothetical protein
MMFLQYYDILIFFIHKSPRYDEYTGVMKAEEPVPNFVAETLGQSEFVGSGLGKQDEPMGAHGF